MITAGFDEVGRGAWAGPLCVVGVSLRKEQFKGLKDSKRYSALKRQQLSVNILAQAHSVAIAWRNNKVIDAYGLGVCLRESFVGCAQQLLLADTYIVDGAVNYLDTLELNSDSKIKADETIPAVAAASIVAKHYRDKYMHLLASIQTKAYGFEQHVGYGTKVHKENLLRLGPSDYHRLSFKGVS